MVVCVAFDLQWHGVVEKKEDRVGNVPRLAANKPFVSKWNFIEMSIYRVADALSWPNDCS